jgi:hypothetical protein
MRKPLALVLLAVLLAAAGCSSHHDLAAGSLGTVRLQMTDAPGPFEHVNLVVTQVAIHRGPAGSSDSTSGWEILDATPATYDLMALRNGVFATLGQALVPAGHYTQVRLKLGAGSNVVVGGVTYPLTVPSGLRSGFKLVGEFDVPANGLLDLALDFDAARSIVQTGSGKYLLKPTCRVMPFSTAGAISGRVLPDTVKASIYALAGADTVATTIPGAGGVFVLTPLAAGTYTVAIDAPAPYADTTLVGVVVVARQTTALGDVQLPMLPD